MHSRPPSFLTRRQLLTGALASSALPGMAAAQGVNLLGSRAMPSASTQTIALEAAPANLDILANTTTPGFAFNGTAPGPVVRLRKGQPAKFALRNALAEPLSVHWHGMRIDNAADGVATLTGAPVTGGGSGEVSFTPPDYGTFIYRPLVPGRTAELTGQGLSGVAIVEDPGLPAVDVDHVLAISDWALDDKGQPAPFALGPGRLGNIMTVNGVPAPARLAVAPGARVRLRLANLSNARIMRIRFDGVRAYVVAVDGQPTDTFEPLKATLPFAPGHRFELVFDMPPEPGSKAMVSALIGQGLPLAIIETAGAASVQTVGRAAIAPLPPNPLLSESIKLQRALRADVTLQGAGTAWAINGKQGLPQPGKPLFSVKSGSPVVLAVKNESALPNVIHIHGHSFRALHPLDDGWEPYWLDTLIVPEGKTIRCAFTAGSPGLWLIGSTILERLDGGLSAFFEVK